MSCHQVTVIEMILSVYRVHVPELALILVKHAELLAGTVRTVCVRKHAISLVELTVIILRQVKITCCMLTYAVCVSFVWCDIKCFVSTRSYPNLPTGPWDLNQWPWISPIQKSRIVVLRHVVLVVKVTIDNTNELLFVTLKFGVTYL